MSENDTNERVAALEIRIAHVEESQKEIKDMLLEVRDALLQAKGIKVTLMLLGAFFGFWLTKGVALLTYFKGN